MFNRIVSDEEFEEKERLLEEKNKELKELRQKRWEERTVNLRPYSEYCQDDEFIRVFKEYQERLKEFNTILTIRQKLKHDQIKAENEQVRKKKYQSLLYHRDVDEKVKKMSEEDKYGGYHIPLSERDKEFIKEYENEQNYIKYRDDVMNAGIYIPPYKPPSYKKKKDDYFDFMSVNSNNHENINSNPTDTYNFNNNLSANPNSITTNNSINPNSGDLVNIVYDDIWSNLESDEDNKHDNDSYIFYKSPK
jgi:hypothetical protein